MNDDVAITNEMNNNNNNNNQYDADNDVTDTHIISSAQPSLGPMYDYAMEYSNKKTKTLQSRTKNNSLKCGNTQKMVDNCFRDLSPHLMEFLQTTKIAINEQEITSKCE